MYNTITYRGVNDLKLFDILFGHATKRENKNRK
jgi:hypothetical protein